MSESDRKNCVIIGAGAVGSVLAHYLQSARHQVRFLVREEELSAYQREPHLRIERATKAPPMTSKAPGLITRFPSDPVDYVFICVKHPNLAEVLEALPEDMPAEVQLVSCLNGVGIARQLRSRFPHIGVSTMTIMFNAQLLEPMHAQITTKPVVYLDTESKPLTKVFQGTDVQVKRAKGESAAWGKLLINLNNAICALTHKTYRDVLCEDDLTALFAAVMDEAVAVLDHAAIRYNLTAPISYPMYRWLLLNAGRLPWWVAKLRNGLASGSYPSMVADIKAGRPTEIDRLNGEIVRLGEQLGVETPINAKIVAMIKACEGKPSRQFLSPQALRQQLLISADHEE